MLDKVQARQTSALIESYTENADAAGSVEDDPGLVVFDGLKTGLRDLTNTKELVSVLHATSGVAAQGEPLYNAMNDTLTR
eukprot:8506193-Karenia_brevis.AAC.1